MLTEKRPPSSKRTMSRIVGRFIVFFIAIAFLATAPDSGAQQAGKVWRIGYLAGSPRVPQIDAFLQGLRDLGYIALFHDAGMGVLTAFSEKTGFVASNGEARRQIKAGGLKVNDKTVSDEKMVLTSRDLTPEGVIKLSLGRKRHVLLKPV